MPRRIVPGDAVGVMDGLLEAVDAVLLVVAPLCP